MEQLAITTLRKRLYSFDRMTAAEATIAEDRLVTKDETIRDTCSAALW